MGNYHALTRLRADRAPLSGLQRGLWFLDQLTPGSAAYNIPWVLDLDGPVELTALQQALDVILARHEALRTTFAVEQDEPCQLLHTELPVPIALTDLRALPTAQQAAAADAAVAQDAGEPFSLTEGPLLRVRLIRHGTDGQQERSTIVAVFHHIVWDEWSMGLFERELTECYDAALTGRTPKLPELPVQYPDYSAWERGTPREGDLAYWRRQLRGAPAVTTLPGDRVRPAHASAHGDTYHYELAPGTAARVRELARSLGATPFTVLLAAFATLVHRYTREQDLVIGTPVSTRSRPELDHLIGYFVNVLPLRLRTEPSTTFRDLVEQARDTSFDAYGHQDTPLDSIVNEVGGERSGNHPPLVQLLFGAHTQDPAELRLGGAGGRSRVQPNGTTKLDLTWSTYDDGELHGEVEFSTDLFDLATIARMACAWRELLTQALDSPDTPLGVLGLLPAAEWPALLPRPAEPAADEYGEAFSLHRGFERQVDRDPTAPALTDGRHALSYAELEVRANRLAHHLREAGVRRGDRVGLYLDRTVEAVVAILAVLKTGAAYVPVDLTAPSERVAFAFADAQVRVVVTDQPQGAAEGPWRTVHLHREAAAIAHRSAHRPEAPTTAEDVAYVIFTSGSTGRPKGVQIAHRSVNELMAATTRQLGIGPGDVATMFHSYAFDVSVWELWSALLHGGKLVVVPYLTCRSPEEFAALLARERVTLLSQTPSAFRQLTTELDERPRPLPDLRRVLLAGEALDPPAVRRWFELAQLPPAVLCNLYGTTETTVHATAHEVGADSAGEFDRSRVGSVLPHLTQVVLDDRLRPVPLGVPGELFIGGEALAHGYLNRPGLTAQRFLADPFSPVPGARMYRTGDLVRQLPGGGLEYLGRRDGQVKVRGYRIELGEIESALAAHPSVATCAVTVHEPAPGDRRLAAYLTAAPQAPAQPAELQRHLRTTLPDYMVPASFTVLAALPLTTNGKIDRAALPEPSADLVIHAEGERVPPSSELEALVAKVWSQVLDVSELGVHDNFFHLGGDSLRAVRVSSALRAAGWSVRLQDFFGEPTVAALARVATPDLGSTEEPSLKGPFTLITAADRALLPATVVDAYPTATMQLAMAYHMELSGSTDSYHNVNSYLVTGEFDPVLFERAVADAMERHPVLRTSIDLMSFSEPLQLVHRTLAPPVHVTDLRQLPEPARQAAVRADFERLRTTGFPLASAPLFAIRVHLLDDQAVQLTIAEHHAILDGWSFTSLLSELLRRHAELIADPDRPPLAAPKSGFGEFVATERAAAADQDALSFWRGRLAGVDGALRPRGDLAPAAGESGVRSTERLVPGIGALLRLAAANGGGTPKSAAFAAHLVALGRITGSARATTGLSVNGRLAREGGTEALGLFLNTVPVSAAVDGDPGALARWLHEQETAMLPYRRVPFATLARLMAGTALDSNFGFLRFHALGRLAEGATRIVSDSLRFEPTMRHEPTNFALSAAVVLDPTSDDGLLMVDHDRARLPERAAAEYAAVYLAVLDAMSARG
ncbi:non-ribosomal peptide synthetase [Kitasatospora kifunensis]|uniref:Amino acid adenylation domain-containing protein n=1 Tax=Kitasatospora kifunensis TaxID=58351 RepID=A0A7W7QX66_KITKI|nr:non-ribosomal peptide synthetase [Kitasatospora kifunensis]MBB4921456.1 amino acid adenylation domain-containing protein [Kitasatospora kifunensis]